MDCSAVRLATIGTFADSAVSRRYCSWDNWFSVSSSRLCHGHIILGLLLGSVEALVARADMVTSSVTIIFPHNTIE